MSKESAYISASELGEIEHPRIVWRVALPDYAPAENILVNVDRLNRLAWLGGMESLRVSSYSGDTTQVSAEAGDINEQGAATAIMKGSVTKAKTYKTAVDNSSEGFLTSGLAWTKGKVQLNITEIDEKVLRKSNLRDPKEWSRQLDKALRPAVRESSWHSLTGKASNITLTPFLLALFSAANLPFDGLSIGLLKDDLTALAVYNLIVLPGVDKLQGRELSERKQTLIPGYPLDRYLAVNVLSRTSPLIKAKKAKV